MDAGEIEVHQNTKPWMLLLAVIDRVAVEPVLVPLRQDQRHLEVAPDVVLGLPVAPMPRKPSAAFSSPSRRCAADPSREAREGRGNIARRCLTHPGHIHIIRAP